MSVVADRLPGIRFEAQLQPRGGALPRMDIAVFVGFAACGPLDLPVVIEDTAQFAAIFGGDVILAWDDERAAPHRAYLGAAVRAFFRNGGQRCWVIRVAESTTRQQLTPGRYRRPAVANQLPVAGLVAMETRRRMSRQAYVTARSEGSWSDGLQVGATLLLETVDVLGIPASAHVLLPSTAGIAPGDLLRLTLPCSGHVLYFGVRRFRGHSADGEVCAAGTAIWFQTRRAAAPADCRRAVVFGGREFSLLSVEEQSGTATAVIDASAADAPPPGSLVRLDFDDGEVAHGWLLVAEDPLIVDDASTTAIQLTGECLWQLKRPPKPLPPLAAGSYAERLTFELTVRLLGQRWPDQASAYPVRISNLGFLPAHPRFWGALPSDSQLYAAPGRAQGTLWQDAGTPRFPVCASTPNGHVYLPLGMSALRDPTRFHGPTPNGDPPLVRDGLASFDADLFLDPALASASVETLQSGADAVRYEQPVPRSLLGLHSSLDIEEAALIAVPDAVHRGWRLTPDPQPLEPAVQPPAQEPAPESGAFVDCEQPPSPAPPPPPSPGVQTRWRVLSHREYSSASLSRIHTALLTLCATLGDRLSILALPEHYQAEDARTCVDQLCDTFAPQFRGERTLSFGALYHPWLVSRDERPDDDVRTLPADGAACGLIARRTLERGAWVAPGNEPLASVLGLTGGAASDPVHYTIARGVNLLRREARGFLPVGANTLTQDDDLRPINVRRLLSLLRRVATRFGSEYAFEPNDGAFRDRVKRRLETLLDELFVRGAFAGATASAAYRVDASASLNTQARIDAGQLVVEIRVAPSRPLTFITIRLIQTAGRGVLVMER
jgi:hypothetical protein